jgi:putative heme-binding domain-containing protein
MLAKVCPWGPIAASLAAAGAVVASLVGARWPTLTLAALGLVAAVLGAVVTGRTRSRRDLAWLALGAVLNVGVLGLVLLAPGLLNPVWAIDAAMPPHDADRMVRVAVGDRMGAGQPLGEGDWVDAATEAIRQDDLLITVKAVKSADLVGKGESARLTVYLSLYQVLTGRTISFLGFAKDQHPPTLTDGAGRSYTFVGHQPERFSAAFDLVPLRVDHMLVFELPPPGAEPLRLTVPASAWGQQGVCRFQLPPVERQGPPDLAAEAERYKRLLRPAPHTPPDVTLGRAIFAKHCRECHTIFGNGGKTGPDLTASKRNDRDFLVTSIINPSAEIAKGFESSIIVTNSGRLVTGIIKESTPEAVVVQSAGAKVTVRRKDIDEIQPSKISLMPTELVKVFDEADGHHEFRSLLAYLSGPGQVSILARPETVVFFGAYGAELSDWQRARGEWKVDRGEIVAPGPQAGGPALLVSDLVVTDDFRVTLRFHPGKDGRGALLLRGPDQAAPAGPRVEFAAGEAVVLTGADGGRAEPVPEGAGRVKAGAWNLLEVSAAGQRLQVRLNGTEAAALADARLPERRVVALEGPAAAGQETRFAQLDLQLPAAVKRE